MRGIYIYPSTCQILHAQAQRDQVSLAEADAAFDNGEFNTAAALYGRVAKGPPSFEEVALKLVEAGASDALQTFLQTRLENLSPNDKVQVGVPDAHACCCAPVSGAVVPSCSHGCPGWHGRALSGLQLHGQHTIPNHCKELDRAAYGIIMPSESGILPYLVVELACICMTFAL